MLEEKNADDNIKLLENLSDTYNRSTQFKTVALNYRGQQHLFTGIAKEK
jgi:inosine/xanthosine triphosphate pyrophosphatase family protein